MSATYQAAVAPDLIESEVGRVRELLERRHFEAALRGAESLLAEVTITRRV